MADPAVWAKTVLDRELRRERRLLDHVVPPTPPPGTPGEFIGLVDDLRQFEGSFGFPGPVGLGFRVPMMMISPFSRGGYCSSEVFDHTSVLFFLEKRFGVEVPYVSQWRRNTVGNLTSMLNFAAPIDLTIPPMPNTDRLLGVGGRLRTGEFCRPR